MKKLFLFLLLIFVCVGCDSSPEISEEDLYIIRMSDTMQDGRLDFNGHLRPNGEWMCECEGINKREAMYCYRCKLDRAQQ